MHKHEEYRMDTRDMREAVTDYLIKKKQITTPDMVNSLTFFSEAEGGDECHVVAKTVSEKVEES